MFVIPKTKHEIILLPYRDDFLLLETYASHVVNGLDPFARSDYAIGVRDRELQEFRSFCAVLSSFWQTDPAALILERLHCRESQV